jgi:hypothetical protein
MMEDCELSGKAYEGRDLLSLRLFFTLSAIPSYSFRLSIVMISKAATDLPPEQRISEEETRHNINTFMYVGSDTTPLALTWTVLLLAKHPSIQDQLRAELCGCLAQVPLVMMWS